MKLLALMLLLAASAGGQLMDEVHLIPAGDWKFVDVRLHRKPARISASYEVLNGAGTVRAALMLREDVDRLHGDLPGAILETAEGRRGSFTDQVPRSGDYVVGFDNQDGKFPVTARLRVSLDFTEVPVVQQLTRSRRMTVVALSFAVFLGIVGFSTRKLRQAMRHQRR